MNQKSQFNPKQFSPKRNKNFFYYYTVVLAVIIIFNVFVAPHVLGPTIVPSSYSHFLSQLDANSISEVKFTEDAIFYTVAEEGKQDLQYFKTGIIDNPNLPELLHEKDVKFSADIPEPPNVFLSVILSWIFPVLFFWFIWRMISKNVQSKMGPQGLSISGKDSDKLYKPDDDRKTFESVAGQEEAKESLVEIIDYLSNPSKYVEIGAECPKGVLLVGPPGTGKTLMAKAVAGEAEVPFFSISGSEFVEMFVGRGAAKVRQLFEQASKLAPCIVFIDEIDTIGKKRDSGMSSNDEREQTLNQLLTEMDGFNGNKGVVILAATNRPEILDPALLRPGRFDRQVRVELPDKQGRSDILKVHLKKVKTQSELDIPLIARMTAGASGAQLANIINEGALRAVRQGRTHVTTEDIMESVEVVIAGQQKKNAILSDDEKRRVAYHEIGHALIAARQSHSAPVEKITIIPRTSGALGYTMQVDQHDKTLYTRDDFIKKIQVLCGGRAAEEVIFGEITTGASNDIEKATDLARQMVTRYGMSASFGMVAFETAGNQYLGGGSQMNCSQETARQIDNEVVEIVKSAYDDAKTSLTADMTTLNRLSEYLLDHETITGKEFLEIVNQ